MDKLSTLSKEEHTESPSIDPSQYPEMTEEDILDVLNLTIKKDRENKLVTFLCQLSAYTDHAQFNISFNAPSSSGKSYIPLEIAKLFPPEDVIKLGSCSPTAFFHEQGEYDKETNQITIKLERKIIIFTDMPNNGLLARLRPLLSHDEKEMVNKITDKRGKGGLHTKTVILRGFPAVIFCSASMNPDEQEATRFLLLSPEVDEEKIHAGIETKIRREVDQESYQAWLDCHPGRKHLKERIQAISQAEITDIKIPQENRIKEVFLRNRRIQPRHQRDVARILAIIKTLALFNCWFRQMEGQVITASQKDIEAGLRLWNRLSEAQELNLPPFVLDVYKRVIQPLFQARNEGRDMALSFGAEGISRQDIMLRYHEVYGRMLDGSLLRHQILPMLENTGLIVQEMDQLDRRRRLVYLTDFRV